MKSMLLFLGGFTAGIVLMLPASAHELIESALGWLMLLGLAILFLGQLLEDYWAPKRHAKENHA